MQLLIIRHAIAEDRELFAISGQSDELRPLSSHGKTKMRKNVSGLRQVIPVIHHIASSPLRRALQTADLLAHGYPDAQRATLVALVPGGEAQAILTYLQQQANKAHTIALVGHEPDLGELITWLLCGQEGTWLPLKKGGVCLLEFTEEIMPAHADLSWVLTPGQLRKMA